MNKKSTINLLLGLAIATLSIATLVVLLNPYSSCGGAAPCSSDGQICLAVCAPIGIKYYIPISLVLIVVAMVLSAILYRRLREPKS